MVAGLLRPERGLISLNGVHLFHSDRGLCLPPEKRKIGYIFQEGRLFPHLTVRGNLRYGMKKRDAAERYARFDHVVDLLNLAPLLHRRPARLSGGEKQRVAMGRALLMNPRMLLMDEPMASLDRDHKAEILPFISRLNREFSIPILYVSHNKDEILHLADHIVHINGGRVSKIETGPRRRHPKDSIPGPQPPTPWGGPGRP